MLTLILILYYIDINLDIVMLILILILIEGLNAFRFSFEECWCQVAPHCWWFNEVAR